MLAGPALLAIGSSKLPVVSAVPGRTGKHPPA
jgi:hypothetical protein